VFCGIEFESLNLHMSSPLASSSPMFVHVLLFLKLLWLLVMVVVVVTIFIFLFLATT